MIWNEANIRLITLGFVGKVQKRPFTDYLAFHRAGVDLRADLNLDSVSLFELAACLYEFFGVFPGSSAYKLLADTKIDNWVYKLLVFRQENDTPLTFTSSGTSGEPKRVTHDMEFFYREAEWLMHLLNEPDQIISMVPAHHMYGFVYTVLLPALWNKPVRFIDGIIAQPYSPRALLVGTPFSWGLFLQTLRSVNTFPAYGISSAAPLSQVVFTELIKKGIHLTEIYGATETGGVGYRNEPDAPFRLFPYLQLVGQEEGITGVNIVGSEEILLLQDDIEELFVGEFRVYGRKDGAVQIAGINVYPSYVEDVISLFPMVIDCNINAKAYDGDTRLLCSIQLKQDTKTSRDACLEWMKANLQPAEMPRHIFFY